MRPEGGRGLGGVSFLELLKKVVAGGFVGCASPGFCNRCQYSYCARKLDTPTILPMLDTNSRIVARILLKPLK
jgi:hypothetical protein